MKKILLAVFAPLLVTAISRAQVSTYSFSLFSGTYSPLNGATTFPVNGGGGTLDDGYSVTQNIPFTFVFDGISFNTYRVNTNGWLGFGTPTSTQNYHALNGSVNHLIAFMNRDFNNIGAVYSNLTVGLAGSRIHIIQASNFYLYNTNTMTGNVQIWLYEGTNAIEIHYGAFSSNWTSGIATHVGLRGSGITNVRSLSGSGVNTWTNPVAGTSSTAIMQAGLAIMPYSGLVYQFLPLIPCSGSPNPGNTIASANPVCPGSNFTLSLQNSNPGTGITYQWQSSIDGNTPWTNLGTASTQIISQTSSTYYRCLVTCSGNSSLSNPLLVSMNYATIPYIEGFLTTAAPLCWNIGTWSVGSVRGVTGNPGNNIYKYLWSFDPTDPFISGMIGPVLPDMVLSFDYKVANFDQPYNPPAIGSGDFTVFISSDEGSTFTEYKIISNNGIAGWQPKYYPLSDYAGSEIMIKIGVNRVSGYWDIAFDNFKVASAPACYAPSELNSTNLMATSVKLNWTLSDFNPACFSDIYMSTSPTPPTSSSIPTVSVGAGVSTYQTHEILSPNTTYYFWVRSDCGGGNQSTWTGPHNITTPCNSINLPFTEGFESMYTDFSCWNVMRNTAAQGGLNGNGLVPVSGDTWFVCTPSSFSGGGENYIRGGIRSAAVDYTAMDINWLISTDIHIPSGGNTEMKFWLWYYNDENYTTKFYVNVLADGIWSTVLTYNSANQNNLFSSEIIVPLNAFSGKVIKVALIYEYNDGYPLAIDDISISGPPSETIWTGATNSSWTLASNWNPGVPGSSTNVVIPGNMTNYPTLISTAYCNNFTIQPGGSFIGSEFLTVNGTTTIERFINAYSDETSSDGWHLISSPVVSQPISGAWTPSTGYDFYSLNESVAEYWINQKNHPEMTGFIPGNGYLAAYEVAGIKTFSGDLNISSVTMSGLTNTPGSYAGSHLVGNPFTSAINSASFTRTNVAANVQVWNSTNAAYEVASTIPALNGFMVYTTGNGALTIPLSARTHSGSEWFKDGKEKMIILQANDLLGNTAQKSMVRFNSLATGSFDMEYDARFLAGFAPMFYSKSGEEGFALNTLPELTNETVIPFSFIRNESTEFNIELVQAIPGALIFLTDKKTSKVLNLTESPSYGFTAMEGDMDDRFLLTFGEVGIEDPETAKIKIYGYGDQLYISGAAAGSEVRIMNLLGQEVTRKIVNGEELNTICASDLSNGVYVISIISCYGILSRKVVIEN